MTTDEARAVAVALDDAGFQRSGCTPPELPDRSSGLEPGRGSRVVRAVPPARRDHVLGVRMTVRHILFGALLASVALTSAAAAGPAASSVPPPVGRIAQELAGGGAKRVIVFASAGGKSYVATAGTRRPKADQRFRVGSVTKTFTATIVLQLVDEGKLGLSDTLERPPARCRSEGQRDHDPPAAPAPLGARELHGLRVVAQGARAGRRRPGRSTSCASQAPSRSSSSPAASGATRTRTTSRSVSSSSRSPGARTPTSSSERIFRPLGLDARLRDAPADLATTAAAAGSRRPATTSIGQPESSRGRPARSSRTRATSSRFYSALLSGRILSAASLAAMKKTVAVGPDARLRASGSSRSVSGADARGATAAASSTTSRSPTQARRVTVSASSRSTDGLSDQQPDESALVCPEVSARSVRGNAAHRLPPRRRHLRDERRRQPTTATRSRERPRLVTRRADDCLRQKRRRLRHEPPTAAGSGDSRAGALLPGHPTVGRSPSSEAAPSTSMNADGSAAAEARARRAILPGHRTGGRSRSCAARQQRRDLRHERRRQRAAERPARGRRDPAWSPDGRRIAFARKIAVGRWGWRPTSRSSS